MTGEMDTDMGAEGTEINAYVPTFDSVAEDLHTNYDI